jgi:predicted amidohydrolase YtcJ
MELVLLGGKILTMDPNGTAAEAIAVRDGKITAVGASEDVRRSVGENARVVNLQGRAVTPGFIDPHNHFSMTVFEPVMIDCRMPPLAGKQAVLDAISVTAKGTPPGQWVWGLGYNSLAAGGAEAVTRQELDEASPDNPVCIMDSSYHACYANSAALALAGIGGDTDDPHKGWIKRGDDEEPNGVLWERAMDPVHRTSMRAFIDHYGEDGVADLVHQNAMRHLSHGITGIGDALTMPESTEMYRIADARGKLPIAVQQLRGGDGFFAVPEQASQGVFDQDNVSDRLRGGAMKLFMDPVFPSYGMNRCHADGHLTPEGEIYYTQDEVDALVLSAAGNGTQVAIHCIGDRAIEQTLNAFERAIDEVPDADKLRLRLEHFAIPRKDQIQRVAEMPVVVSIQPAMLRVFGRLSEHVLSEFGVDAPPFPYRDLTDAGATIAASSDAPCAPLSPLEGVEALVTRSLPSDGGTLAPEQALTVEEVSRQYTNGSAYATNRDDEVGSLEVGKRADMVVLSHDPTAVDPNYISQIEVQQTYVDGELLYER